MKKINAELKHIKKYFNLDLFIKNIEKYFYKFWYEGDMLGLILDFGLRGDPKNLNYDNKEIDKLTKLSENYELLPEITDNFFVYDTLYASSEVGNLRATMMHSEINKTYYLFIDNWLFDPPAGCDYKSICILIKSKYYKTIFNKARKVIDLYNKNMWDTTKYPLP